MIVGGDDADAVALLNIATGTCYADNAKCKDAVPALRKAEFALVTAGQVGYTAAYTCEATAGADPAAVPPAGTDAATLATAKTAGAKAATALGDAFRTMTCAKRNCEGEKVKQICGSTKTTGSKTPANNELITICYADKGACDTAVVAAKKVDVETVKGDADLKRAYVCDVVAADAAAAKAKAAGASVLGATVATFAAIMTIM